MRTLDIQLALILMLLAGTSQAQGCYESTIRSPTPFMGKNGEIFKLADGSLWEVKYDYHYLYAYYPEVVICPSKGKLSVGGKTVNIERIGGDEPSRSKSSTRKTENDHKQVVSDAVIESQINGDFQGWEGETIFKLTNGQIWQQSEYAYSYHYAYRPEVMIFSTNGGYKLKVEGMDEKIAVKRLK